MNPVTFAIELLFAAVFVGALISFIRRQDPLAGDVTLVFTPLAAIFVLQVARAAFQLSSIPPILGLISIALILAQPFFTLRLVSHVRELPAWTLPAAGVAFVVTAVPFMVLSQTGVRSPLLVPILLAAIGVFVVTELAAAVYLAIEARRRAGSARTRLAVAALGTAALAVAILAAGAAAGTGASGADECVECHRSVPAGTCPGVHPGCRTRCRSRLRGRVPAPAMASENLAGDRRI